MMMEMSDKQRKRLYANLIDKPFWKIFLVWLKIRVMVLLRQIFIPGFSKERKERMK